MKAFILAVFLVLATATAVMAKPGSGNFGSQISAAQCDPSGGKLVLNIVFQVTNVSDSGENGNYWALDSIMRHVQAWDMGSDPTGGTHLYCIDVRDTGSFMTAAGESPGLAFANVGAGVTGTLEGGAILTVHGTLVTSLRSKGKIADKDCGCVLGTDQCQESSYKFVNDYFGTSPTFNGFWGWTYRAGDNGTWVNASTGNEGDITGNP